ncbi:MAG: hypothetical protein SF069_10495 [Phycisphaerae bacterium]|nr:hypothetical protein [Phycisphaerae bacterium]
MLSRRILIALSAVLLPALLLLPLWRNAGLGAGEDDILYYWPMRLQFQRCFDAGEWPLLNPWNGLGRPFLADPQTAIFYPPTWLFALTKIDVAYPLHLALHVALAFYGTYRLARNERRSEVAAVFAAIAFAFCGFLLAHRAHFTMQAAAAWAPLVIWRVRRAIHLSESSIARGIRAGVIAAICLALQALAGHVQMAALTALGCVVMTFAEQRRATGPAESPSRSRTIRFGALLIIFIATAGLFALQAIPTWRYMRVCERVSWSYWQFTENSLLPTAALTMLSPFVLGQRTPNTMGDAWWGPSHQSEQTGYIGVLTLILAALSLRLPWRAEPQRGAWAWLLLIAILLALGRYGPLCPLLYWLPGSQLFRCPARALLLVDLALALLAAATVDDLVRTATPDRARLRWVVQQWLKRWPLLVAVFVLTPLLIIALALPWLPAATATAARHALSPLNPALWAATFITLTSVGALAAVARRSAAARAAWLLPAVLALDLGVVGWSLDVPREPVDLRRAAHVDPDNEWLGFVTNDPGRLWVVTPKRGDSPGEYELSTLKAVANTNILEPVELLTDYGPFQPRVYVREFGFRPWGETARAEELLSNSDWMIDARLRWVLLCDTALPAPSGATLTATTSHGWRLYRNDAVANLPLAQFVDAEPGGDLQAEWISNHQLRIQVNSEFKPGVEATEPPLIAQLPLIAIPGWTAYSGGVGRPIEVDEQLFLRVPLTDGAQSVVVEYRPPGLEEGLKISIGSVALLGLLFLASFALPRR